MDENIKGLLLNIQSEIEQMNNKLDKIERVAANGNYSLTETMTEHNKTEINK
jgi:hypothetical protein